MISGEGRGRFLSAPYFIELQLGCEARGVEELFEAVRPAGRRSS